MKIIRILRARPFFESVLVLRRAEYKESHYIGDTTTTATELEQWLQFMSLYECVSPCPVSCLLWHCSTGDHARSRSSTFACAGVDSECKTHIGRYKQEDPLDPMFPTVRQPTRMPKKCQLHREPTTLIISL